MTMKSALILSAILLGALALYVGVARAEDDDLEYKKQMLRYSYTEFCNEVKRPPEGMRDLLDALLKQHPKEIAPMIAWFSKVAEGYEKRKCGDV